MGDLIRKEVKKVFNESKVPEYLNKTNDDASIISGLHCLRCYQRVASET